MNLSIETTPITILLIALIGLTSFFAFSNNDLKNKLIFSPYRIKETNEWYRFLTSGFIHGDWMHLLFNMYVFAQFSGIMERTFNQFLGDVNGKIATLALFLLGVIVSHISIFIKHKNHSWYQSLGASGGVSSVLFAYILLYPLHKLHLFFIPIGIPAFIVGIGYLFYSNYLARKGSTDNISHEAHYYGGLWGILFVIGVAPEVLPAFVEQITTWVSELT